MVDPPPAKTVDFFQKKFRKYSACPEKPFKLTPFVFIVTHSLGTGSNEIFIKKNRLFSERGGGASRLAFLGTNFICDFCGQTIKYLVIRTFL